MKQRRIMTSTGTLTEYAFVLPHTDGEITTAHETHRRGLFSEASWVRLLTESGLAPRVVREDTYEDRPPSHPLRRPTLSLTSAIARVLTRLFS